MKKLASYAVLIITAIVITMLITVYARPAIQQIAGLAVAQTTTKWNSLKDAAAGDNLINGIGAFNLYLYDGTNFDRARGDATYGLDVDVLRLNDGGNTISIDDGGGSITVDGTISVSPSGSNFFAVKRTDIDSLTSVNIAFGFTSKKVVVEVPGSNTDEICVDWTGGTAECPAANTAGDDRIAPGRTIILDDYTVSSISVIAASGTQTVYVRAFN